MKHAHFLIMGGFHLVEPVEGDSTSPEVATTGNDLLHLNVQAQATSTPSVEEGTGTDAENGRVPSGNRAEVGRVTILTLELLQGLVQDPEFGIQVTEKEIADKSKGDGLTKIILIFQSSWFMLQCIARYVQGLSLTQLELTTLALASLNGITFILWWDKPLGVQAPMRVYLKRKLTEAERDVGRQRGSSARSWFVSAFIATVSGPNPFGIVIRAVLREPWSILLLPFAIYVLLVLPIVVFLFSIITTYSDLLGQSSFPADATHVPTFYVPKHRYPKYLHVLLLIALATTFGAIHCAGWNLSFPTHTGQKLWRVTSLAVTIVPIAALPATLISFIVVSPILITIVLIIGTIARRLGLSNFVLDLRSSIVNSIVSLINSIVRLPLAIVISSFDQDQISVLAFLLINYMLLYASARLVLLGLAVALLKHQPDSAFIAVDWTMFYPHTS